MPDGTDRADFPIREPASLESAIAQLPESLAVALRLHRAGYPDEAIADALGIPHESVAVTLHLARAKLAVITEMRWGEAEAL